MVSFHKELDKYTFSCFVKSKKDLASTLASIPSWKRAFSGRFNAKFFTDSYCKEYVQDLYVRMQREKDSRKLGFSCKERNFHSLVIGRFLKNKKNWAFLPQINLSKAFGCSQKTVSNRLRKMCEEGYLKPIKEYKYNSKDPKAKEYKLLPKGIELYKRVVGSVPSWLSVSIRKVVNTIKEVLPRPKNPRDPEEMKQFIVSLSKTDRNKWSTKLHEYWGALIAGRNPYLEEET